MFSLINDLGTSFGQLASEIAHFFSGLSSVASGGHIGLLILCLLLAFAFEFVNGFHDTANAVATVIYTNSLKPWPAVIWAGFCNFLGVFIGGTVVAMAIVKLIPPDLIVSADLNTSMAFILSMLLSALIWNLGTWYFGIPASSSHTLIGAILGIGMGHALVTTGSIATGVNWGKAGDVGLALLVSPLVGFGMGALVLLTLKLFFRDRRLHTAPKPGTPPPWSVRAILIGTSTGVSFAHGSNDGQKGVGLVMLILIALMPAQYALKPTADIAQIQQAVSQAAKLPDMLGESYVASLKAKDPSPTIEISLVRKAIASEPSLSGDLAKIKKVNSNVAELEKRAALLGAPGANDAAKLAVRNQIFLLDKSLGDIEKSGSAMARTAQWKEIKKIKASLVSFTDYVPLMVLILVAVALGFGTTIGWKRVVITIGEKIGHNHLTYAQGASAELVAMGTIAASTFAGFPVSTTHILSSG
ncbi:MAG TPA: inorganic phosphate transporter, partial [Bdellovibrionales bacterium]|nr:inorganic phosphate transporter [Bdellovibrionales bacterium]